MITAFFNDIEKVILANLVKAKSEVKIAVAWFTNPKIFAALDVLQESGVEMQLIVADDRINFTLSKDHFRSLLSKRIEVRVSRFTELMHHKFCIIDNSKLITGSYNWTRSAEVRNHENIILSNEKLLIDQFLAEYSELWKATVRITSIREQDFTSYASPALEKQESGLVNDVRNFVIEEVALGDDANEDEVPEEIEAQLDEAHLLYLEGKLDKAIELCNAVLAAYPNSAEAYDIIATCKWRQDNFREQIQFAKKAVDLDNTLYDAHNVLGIGYYRSGNATKSIESYDVCITAEPSKYIYYRNRAESHADIECDLKVPKNFRDQHARKAVSDWRKVIELANEAEVADGSYGLYYNRGVANLSLNQLHEAKLDLLKAKQLYDEAKKWERDVHEGKEIRQYLRDIDRMRRGTDS